MKLRLSIFAFLVSTIAYGQAVKVHEGNVVTPLGSVTAPPISAKGDSNTGFYYPGADTIGIAAGGLDVFRSDGTRNRFINPTAGGNVHVRLYPIGNAPGDNSTGYFSSTILTADDVGNAAPVMSFDASKANDFLDTSAAAVANRDLFAWYNNGATNVMKIGATGTLTLPGQAAVGSVVENKTDNNTASAELTNVTWTSGVVNLTNATTTSISGVVAQTTGAHLTIINSTGGTITIKNEGTNSTAANRFRTSTNNDMVVGNTVQAQFIYSNSRWTVFASTSVCAVRNSGATNSSNFTQSCNANEYVVGGGCSAGNATYQLNSSSASSATAWQCVWQSGQATSNVAQAICCRY